MSRVLKKKTQLAAKYVVRKEVSTCNMQLKFPGTERVSSVFPEAINVNIYM